MRKPFNPKNALRNPWLKLAGLGLAVMLWFHVATNKEYETTVQYTFKYVNLPDSLTLAAPPATTIDVTAKGSGKLLLRLLWQRRTWEVDLADAEIGSQTLPLGPSVAPLFGIEGIEILDLQGRDHLTLAVDALDSEMVPLVSDLVWAVPSKFTRVGPEQWVPDSVLVKGPRQTLANIRGIQPVPPDLENVTTTVDREVALREPDAYGVEISPTKVRLHQVIEPFVEKVYPNLLVSVATSTAQEECYVEPQFVSVTLGGPRSLMEQAKPESISVVCAVADEDTSGARRSIWVHVPEPLQVLETRPDSVTIWRNGRTQTSSRN
jgi:YbbR domain-containing protein